MIASISNGLLDNKALSKATVEEFKTTRWERDYGGDSLGASMQCHFTVYLHRFGIKLSDFVNVYKIEFYDELSRVRNFSPPQITEAIIIPIQRLF